MPNAPVDIQVSADGRTLWVNAHDGSCIGRSSKRFGIDVHATGSAQLDGQAECLFCLHAPGGPAEWARFRKAMKQHHGVHVPERTMAWS